MKISILSNEKVIPTQPVERQAIVPPMSALTASFEKTGARFGLIAPIAPIIIPIDAKFENPHNA